MSFLRSLAQRARGDSASALRPRVASRFEADPASARLVEERVEREAPTAPRATGSVEQAPGERPALAPFVTRGPETPPPAATPWPEAAPLAPPGPRLVPAEPAAVLTALAVPAMPVAAAAPAAVEIRALAPPAPPLVPPTSTLLVEHVTERVVETRERVETRVVAPEASGREPAAPSPRIAQPVLAPAVAVTRGEPAPPVGTLFGTSAGAPAIHVTIGRIDVRAVHVPPPAVPVSQPAPHVPLLSLDDYLARRAAP